MKHWRSIAPGALAALALAAQALAVEVPLKLVRHSEDPQGYQPYGYQSLRVLTQLPTGRWQLPELVSDKPLYAQIELAGEKRLLLFDKVAADDDQPGRLFFDANGNGNLTDDPVLGSKADARLAYMLYYAPARAELHIGNATVEYYFRVRQYGGRVVRTTSGATPPRTSFLAQSYCHYEGEFALGGQRYHILLGDSNANGRFDDAVTWRKGRSGERTAYCVGDRFFLSDEETIRPRGFHYFAHHLAMGKKLFDVALDVGRARMTLRRSRAASASISMGMPIERMTLCDAEGEQSVMLYRPAKTVRLPAGRYCFTNYEVLRRDPQGDLWSLSATPTAETPFADLSATGATLTLGEPYVARAQVPEYSRARAAKSGKVSIQFDIVGAGNERVTDLTHLSGDRTATPLAKKGNRPKEPSYRILDPGDKVVASGSFEYG